MNISINNNDIHVVLACNNNYVPYLAVTIQSIIETASKNREYNVYILHSKITDENCAALLEMSTGNVKVQFMNVSKLIADKNLYTKHHISEETYYRALIPELLPKVEKVAYIDCDLVVVKDIAQLYDVDISNYFIGAVKNFCSQMMVDYIDTEIGIPYIEYFNAGVLLLNLNEFRKNNIAERFFALAQGEKKFNLMDQDMLNILCNKSVLYLDSRWNVSWQHVFKRENEFALLDFYKEEYEAIVKDPYIVHYTTEKKAWDYKDAPLADYFWKVANKNAIFCNYNEKKKVLLVTHEMDYAGSEHSLRRVAIALQNAGYTVNVWSYQQGDFAREFKKIDIQIRIVNGDKVDQEEYVNEYKKYDLIIANTVATYKVVKAAQDIVPTIWYIREAQNIPQFFRGKSELYETLYKAYCIYTVSEYAKEFICQNYNPNVHVIHNCVDDEYKAYHKQEKKKNSKSKIKFLTLGTIEERKGYDVYLHAYMNLPKEYQERCEVHFAGRVASWAKNYGETLLEESKAYENIVYHGEIQDREKLLRLVDDMDVVVVASRDESCSLVALEGAMMGKALLVTENVGAKYIVKEETGWIVKTGDVDALREMYMKICDAKNKLSRFGKSAREEYLRTSTFDIFNGNIVAMAKENICVLGDYKKRITEAKARLMPVNMENYPRALVSYDIFDTVLTRMTATPRGIFALMQYYLLTDKRFSKKSNYLRENFYDLRINAEACARNVLCNRTKAEITLSDIYSTINLTEEMAYETLGELKKLEQDVEYMVSIGINEKVEEFVRRMQDKQRLAYISDMYLDREFVRKLLHKADSRLADNKIYISSMYNKTKASGYFYSFVKNDSNVPFSSWMHIGDNTKSDGENATKWGITTKLYEKSALLPWERALIEANEKDVQCQLAIGAAKNARINHQGNTSMAFNVGAAIGGSILYPYVRWTVFKARLMGIKRLYFVARDGYILKKIADVIIEKCKYDISTHYVYGSRQSWRLPAVSVIDRDFERFFDESLPHYVNDMSDIADMFQITLDELLNYLPNVYRLKVQGLNSADVLCIKKTLLGNRGFKQFIAKKQSDKRIRVIEYMQQEVDTSDDKFAFVELNGSGFTQYCLASLMGTYYTGSVCTFFLKLNSVNKYNSQKIRLISYMPNNLKASHVLEVLCRAPHGQTIDYCLKYGRYEPVMDDTEGNDLLAYGYNDYTEGIEEFTKYLVEAEIATNIKVTNCNLTINGLEYVVKTPHKDILTFIGDIPFGATGREKVASTFAPILTNNQIERIYLKREKVQRVYSGASIDMSLLRCTEEQVKLIEAYEEKRLKESSDEKTEKKSKIKKKLYGKNYIPESDFALLDLKMEGGTEITELTKQSTEIHFDNSDGRYKVGNYVWVEKRDTGKKLSHPVRIIEVSDNGLSFFGRPVSTNVGDVVKSASVSGSVKVTKVLGDWELYSKNNDGMLAKLKSGVLIEKPVTEQMSLIRFGKVLEIPEELKGEVITWSLQCEQVINEVQFNFATSETEITLQSAGLNDDSVAISKRGQMTHTTLIPSNAKFMRVMVQIPTKGETRILIEQIKLEKGEESSLNNVQRYFRHIPEVFSFKKVMGAVQCVKDSGIKYTLHRIGEHISGKE